jgi:cephalosporin hydroxylase
VGYNVAEDVADVFSERCAKRSARVENRIVASVEMNVGSISGVNAKSSAPDDRAEFVAERRRHCLALGADEAIRERAFGCTADAERHNYSYLWSWMGVPIIQMPPDIIATQEIIWKTRPDVVIETGVARGGSMVFYASILALAGKGKVVGVDIDIRAHNRDTIEKHPMASRIALVQGSSIAEETVAQVRAQIPVGASVMVILDSDHSKRHVLAELRAYAPLVTAGQYLIVADTILGFLKPDQSPRQRSRFLQAGYEPLAALNDYLRECDRFEPDAEINGKMIFANSPGGYLRCVKP